MSHKSKQKGNIFENKIAKELGKWMFDDIHMLGREITSGAKKCAWVGDIIPQKQLPNSWCDIFPLYIECKSGYDDKCPTFFNYDILKKWLDKCEKDKTEQQHIILLITQFKNKRITLLTSNYVFNINNMTWFIHFKHNEIDYYVYDYKTIISFEFKNFNIDINKY